MRKIYWLWPLLLALFGCDMSTDINARNIKGYPFSLFEVQEYCTVERQGDEYLKVKCELAKLKPVTVACEGLMTQGLKDPKFLCSGGLWSLKETCYVEMLSTTKGNIKCRK